MNHERHIDAVQRRRASRPRVSLCWILAIAFLLGSCSADEPAPQWGTNADTFFAEWDAAWSGADPYDIVRFYDTDVVVGLIQDYRSLSLGAGFSDTAVTGDGRAWLTDWIDKQIEPRQRALDHVYVGRSEALALVTIDEDETAVAVSMTVTDTSITASTDMRWRDAHLPGGAPDNRLQWLDDLATTYAAAWTTGDEKLRALYQPGATIEAFSQPEVDLDTALSMADLRYGDAVVSDVATGERAGPALFIGPDSAAIGLEAKRDDGCLVQSVVLFTLQDQKIVTEKRLLTPDSVRRCFGNDAPARGWWNALAVPVPVDEQVSGSVTANDGTEITIVNGTPELERLLEWGLGRFEATGLPAPRLASATFAPVPACASAPGLVTETVKDKADLILCTDAYEACLPDRASCTDFQPSVRLGMLHELGHAWLLENLSAKTESEFLALNDLSSWGDPAQPWHRRGAEQAAETMAWGLLEQPISLFRIGNPPCDTIAAGFELLTGTASLHGCEG
ncbi:MAG: hypothetical protein WBV06_19420 [Acidimicrobiia bacterium]